MAQAQHMRIDKIHDMDIVADAGAVRRPDNRCCTGQRPGACRRWHQGSAAPDGFLPMEFAHLAVGIGARHVEIAEDHRQQPRPRRRNPSACPRSRAGMRHRRSRAAAGCFHPAPLVVIAIGRAGRRRTRNRAPPPPAPPSIRARARRRHCRASTCPAGPWPRRPRLSAAKCITATGL